MNSDKWESKIFYASLTIDICKTPKSDDSKTLKSDNSKTLKSGNSKTLKSDNPMMQTLKKTVKRTSLTYVGRKRGHV